MENKKHQPDVKQPTKKQTYEPPEANFVAIKMEESLLSCNWYPYRDPNQAETCYYNCASPSSS